MTFDAVIVANSPHAGTVLLGLTLVERARRVAGRVGARRTYVIEDAAGAAGLAAWDADRGDAALLVIRGGDRLVHPPLIKPLLEGRADRRLAVGPTGTYAGALWVCGDAARDVIGAIAASPANGDAEVAARWAAGTASAPAERIPHGDIAVHLATTPAERKAATRMLLRILTKADEDSPVSKYIYRPLSKPLTQLLLHTPITPNQVSILVGLIGLIGCWFTAQPGQGALIWGAGLVFASGILDGCDGEIARLKLTSSPLGAWLDTIVDEVTSVAYFIAIGYHTYALHPEPWIAASIVIGTLSYVASIYGIYYFCIVVLKAGGSQYYVGTLDVVDAPGGAGLRARPRAPSNLAPWMLVVGQWALYVIRRDFINLAAFAITFMNGYAVIYGGILVGALVSGTIITSEHLRLRGQLREVARRGGGPRLV
ncbi:MAG: CDP-alcohol phosphatidyltransferase family protein [Myxococcota bacterium]|nr:CDP-alcohol phosphatidyltransferase family protein [Myxococcota bacterium]